jgi:timeless
VKRTRKGRRKKTSNSKNENSEPTTENTDANNADPTDGTKCPPEPLPDLRPKDPAVEASPSQQVKVDESSADVPNTLDEAAPSQQVKVDESSADVPNTLSEAAVNRDSTGHPEGDKTCADSGEMKTNLIDEEDETSDSSSDDHQPTTSEVNFDVSRLISSLANNSVVQNICWLLKHYKSNSFRTNHYIICMLRRFCEDLQLSPMLYQVKKYLNVPTCICF